jgi:hypothetical protein
MKSLRLFAIAFLAGLATVRADLTVVQKVEGTEGLQRITMKVKGDKARVEVSPQITTIIDGKSGAITNLLNDKKIVMHIPGDKAKAMAEMAKAFVKEETPTQAPPKPTAKRKQSMATRPRNTSPIPLNSMPVTGSRPPTRTTKPSSNKWPFCKKAPSLP